ncbi:MAG: hypothetical protein Q7S48_01720 [bacterium]|nr:hypothetical protein [bacterium]
MIDFKTIIGIAGAGLVLLAFVLNQFHFWKDDEFRYDFINFVGGTFLVTYALLLKSYPFAVLNGVWALVSLRDTIRDLRK